MTDSEKTTRIMEALRDCDTEISLLEDSLDESKNGPQTRRDLTVLACLRELRALVVVLLEVHAYERSENQGGYLRFPGLATQLEVRSHKKKERPPNS